MYIYRYIYNILYIYISLYIELVNGAHHWAPHHIPAKAILGVVTLGQLSYPMTSVVDG